MNIKYNSFIIESINNIEGITNVEEEEYLLGVLENAKDNNMLYFIILFVLYILSV